MTLIVDVAREGVVVPLAAERIKALVRGVCAREKVKAGLISVTFVTDRAMARMNREYLDHRGATDIITFELRHAPGDAGGVVMGDMYIAPGVARANARANGVGVREELARLVIHGTLHVLGYTHPEDEARLTSPMWRKQERYVAALA